MTTDLEERAATALAALAAHAHPHPDIGTVLHDAARRPVAIDPGLEAAHRVAGTGVAAGPTARQGVGDPPVRLLEVDVRRTRGRWLPLVATAAAVAGIIGAAVVSSRDGKSELPGSGLPGPSAASTNPPAFSWTTRHVALSADSITIEYLGQTFTPPADATIQSYLLSRTEELVRIEWPQHGIKLGWELSLTSRDDEWWVDRIAVQDERTNAEGNSGMSAVHIDHDSERRTFGTALTGDLDVSSTEAGATARVRITGMRLAGFRDRGPDGAFVPIETVPAPSLVPAPPLPDDVAPTGMYIPVRDWVAFSIAQDTLVSECMATAGFDLPVMPDESVVQLYGQFESSAGLSVQGRRAAAATGYHSADPAEAFAWFADAEAQVPEDRRDEFHGATAGCEADSSAVLGWTGDSGPMRSWGVVGDVREQAYGDPRVITALDSWGQCVYDIVGERAANPNELARMYAFANGDPNKGTATDHEKAVALADFDCQQQVDYETVWYTAVVERERAAMGDRVGEYDQWVRDYLAMIARAQQVLDERGIVLPSLD